MINCIAIDDEPLALNVVKNYSKKVSSLNLMETFNDAFLAMEFVRREPVDAIFLDINMPKLSGISFVKTLSTAPAIIFTTAYPQYAVEGFELEAIDYLVKPFPFDRFVKAVNKISDQLRKKKEEVPAFIFIKSDKKLFKVNVDDILYIEAYGDYVKIFTKERMLLSKMRLMAVMENLPETKFVQIHRKFIVSKNALSFIEGNSAVIGEIKLPISNSFKETFLNSLKTD